MSGGMFDYGQYRITLIADSIQDEIDRSGRKKTEEELEEESWRDPSWYIRHPEDLYHHRYSEEVIEQFKITVKKLREAQVYAHRVDWLLSDDDGEATFLERLKEDLSKIGE